ncbi:MAG: endonuclease/exonuclease/phosphatase family protein, partial [Planctomycetota bacterium]|nr:endonuclease/exonuclease/phosphatase family protein [Planctomycetota bacterium]
KRIPVLALLLLAALVGSPVASAQNGAAPAITIDGRLADWPAGVAAFATPDSVFLRLQPGDFHALQAAPYTTIIAFDLDADATTGRRWAGDAERAEIGIDLAVILSPPDTIGQDGMGRGARLEAIDTRGVTRTIEAADLDFLSLPTYAADEYEMRLSRSIPGDQRLARLLERAGEIRIRAARIDFTGATLWASPVISIEAPAYARESLSRAALPKRPDGALRVVSANVLWGSPLSEPDRFARVYKALEPDVILLQEWDTRDWDEPVLPASAIADWFNTNVPIDGAWSAHRTEQRGVAIVTRHEIASPGFVSVSPVVLADGEPILDRTARVVTAVIKTPFGEFLTASVHLKCCGGFGGPEDLQRIEEASAINAALRELVDEYPDSIAVIGGDFNAVGSRLPVEILGLGLDADGGALQATLPLVLGDETAATWGERGNPFPPGRLDYILTCTKRAAVANAFLLNTAVLDEASLAAMGLESRDSTGSDHLPVIVDIVPAR